MYRPATGFFFLNAVRLAELPGLTRHRRLAINAVFAGSLLLVVRGVLLPIPDLLGLVTWLVFVRFLFFGRHPLLYAVSFSMTMALEFYGTTHGVWAWAPVLPIVGLSAANPPAGIGAGYCAMDGIARRLASFFERSLHSARPPLAHPVPADHSSPQEVLQ